MKIDGHCHCGRHSFEAELDPAAATICHCTDCQTLSGSAFRFNIRVAPKDFVLHGPAPSTYVKTAESGTQRLHAFCGNCGTPLYATSVDTPTFYSLRAGTITQRASLLPGLQIWNRSRLAWVDALAGLPAHDKQ